MTDGEARLREMVEEMRQVLRKTATTTDGDACNSCTRKFGWQEQRFHCAYCGSCLLKIHSSTPLAFLAQPSVFVRFSVNRGCC